MKHILGVNLGATNIRAGVVSADGEIILKSQEKLKTHAKKRLEDFIFDFLEEILKKAEAKKLKVNGIGVGSPGPIDLKKGVIKEMPNFPEIQNWNFKKDLKEKFHLPIRIEKDSSATLLGESWKGLAKGKADVLLLALGTGVGGAALIDGRLLRGTSGEAAEFGHITVDSKGEKCGCGKKGCLEVYCGGKGIERMAREKGFKNKSAKEIFDLARQHNQKAEEIISQFKEALKIGLGDLINIFNPELIILSGKIVQSSDLFLTEVRHDLKKFCFSSLLYDLKIKKSEMIDEAGLLGAAYLFFGTKPQ